MNNIVKPLVMQGQSPYHILTNHPELDVSVKTLYNYIDQGVLLTRNIDLKRKPKFKPRKTEQTRITNREVFNGRTYQDFQALNPEHFAEMDTVISAKGSDKCILTFFLPDSELFLAYLLNRRTAGAVRAVFDRLEKALGTYRFLTLFETILTDRGSELFFVKHFSLKKASNFPVFIKGFSLLLAGTDQASRRMRACSIR